MFTIVQDLKIQLEVMTTNFYEFRLLIYTPFSKRAIVVLL